MTGRVLRFARTDREGVYDVASVALSRVDPQPYITLGQVERIVVSTDSKIAGTRLRRPGKGRPGWRAKVAGGELQGNYSGGYRVESVRGQTWDRREDAARALWDYYRQEGGGPPKRASH